MRKLLLGSVGVVALVSFLTAGFAGAKPRECVGDFTLTSETRWGTAILPPGHYTFELDEANDLITVRGQNRAVIFVSRHDEDNRVDSNALILASRDGKHVVRALRLASERKVFFFAVPKETLKAVAQGPVLIERMPVTLNGN